MSSSLRRGALAAAALAFSITSLAACAAGNDAQTLGIKPDNAATSVDGIGIQNALVITQPGPESTGPAVVAATLYNSGKTAQTLEAVSVAGGPTAELKPAKRGNLTIPAGGSLVLGGSGNASAVLPTGREAIKDGDAQKITFTFSETGDVSLRAFVAPAENYFESWGPSEVPAAPGTSSAPTADPSVGAEPEGTSAASPSTASDKEHEGGHTEGHESTAPTAAGTASESAAGH